MTENWPSRYPGKHSDMSNERYPAGFENSTFDPFATSLLEPQETSTSNRLKPTYRAQFLESCIDEYNATVEAYREIYPNPSCGPRYALERCRKHAYFARDRVSGDVKVMTDSCRERWCPMCAAQKAKYAREATQNYITHLAKPRFLTLTLRHCEDSLKSQIEFLQDSFRRLRTRAYWKKRVTGGIWFLQVHRSENDGCWHPHFHILLDGHYLEQGELSELWDLVSYGSPVLDIRQVHNPESTSHYVARYSARPARFEKMLLDDRVEMMTALKGKRLCGTFGNAKCVTLTPPKISSGGDWQHLGYYDELVKEAHYNPTAQEILLCWSLDKPISEELFEEYTGIPVTVKIPTKEKKEPIQYQLDFFNSS